MLTVELLQSVHLIAFDFDGVFTDNTVYVSHDGIESVRCWRSDGLGLSRIRSIGINAVIVSTEVNPVVSVRAGKLNLPCRQGVADKASELFFLCEEMDINPSNVMFVGNDINDIPAFKSVGIPVCVADAYPEVFPYVLYRTQNKGGHGAVREICDLIFNARSNGLSGI